jgi:hypothetical protein
MASSAKITKDWMELYLQYPIRIHGVHKDQPVWYHPCSHTAVTFLVYVSADIKQQWIKNGRIISAREETAQEAVTW